MFGTDKNPLIPPSYEDMVGNPNFTKSPKFTEFKKRTVKISYISNSNHKDPISKEIETDNYIVEDNWVRFFLDHEEILIVNRDCIFCLEIETVDNKKKAIGFHH